GGDQRPHELEREADRARLERRKPRRGAERVTEELLVDVHLVAVQLRVDGVAAAAEVDEVEQREMILQLLVRDLEALHQVRGRDNRLALLAARGEQVCEQGLEQSEALGSHRPRRSIRG